MHVCVCVLSPPYSVWAGCSRSVVEGDGAFIGARTRKKEGENHQACKACPNVMAIVAAHRVRHIATPSSC